MSDKKYVKKKISYCLKSRKPTHNKNIHEALTLVNLIPQQSSVFAKEYKPNKKQKQFSQIIKTNADLLFKM